MNHYDLLARFERDGFDIIIDKTWEDIDVRDCFDDECFNIQELRDDINSGKLDWFQLRVRVLIEGHELGSAYLGGCLYSDAREVLSDGTAEDQIQLALEEAKRAVWPLMRRLQVINEQIESVA